MSKKIVLPLLAVLVLTLSACTRAASTPLPTATLEANFPAAVATTSMNVVEQAGTQTAIAQTGTPQGGEAQPPAETPAPGALATFTPLAGGPVVVNATPTTEGAAPAAATPLPSPTVATGSTTGSTAARPASYALKAGEFPFCIARRYNINQYDLLTLNGLSLAQANDLQVGFELKIPQSGKAFEGNPALKAHPVAYTVRAGDTIYSVACQFGNVDPLAIASANNLAAPYTLTAGAQINIP